MADAGDAAAEAAANRDLWTQANREYGDEHAHRAWAGEDITWGIFNVPEQQLGVLGDVRGLDVVELGCGTAYFSAWLAQRGARPIGVDVTPAQLESARRCQDRFGISFPFIEADAAKVPLPSSHFDLAISECGASLWCDPARWVPEAARLLRPGREACVPHHHPPGHRVLPGTGRARPPRTLSPATPGTPPGDVAVRYPVPPRHGE